MVLASIHFIHIDESVRVKAFELFPVLIENARNDLVPTEDDVAEMTLVKVLDQLDIGHQGSVVEGDKQIYVS